MLPGSPILFIWLEDRPFGIQLASIMGYSAATILYTFSANRGMQRYLFECPYVRSQFRRLAVRHIGFLVGHFLLQTALISIRPRLSPWWMTASVGPRGMPPFTFVMLTFCGALLLAEIIPTDRFSNAPTPLQTMWPANVSVHARFIDWSPISIGLPFQT